MKQLRVLVVEDNSATQDALEKQLFLEGCRVRIIGSAYMALGYLKRGEERFDAVVIGANPFGMTCSQLLAEMENCEELRGVPIILCGSSAT